VVIPPVAEDDIIGIIGYLKEQVARLGRRVAELEARPPRVPLSAEERTVLQADWATLVCQHCGRVHYGMCPRVARLVTHSRANERDTTVEYWPNDQWQPPADALTTDDVWGTFVPPKASSPVQAEPAR
jgi:hypothetical protein